MKHIQALLSLVILLTPVMWSQDSAFVRQNYTKHEYNIPMRDGVKLFTSVYVPKDVSEPHPILITRTPYSVGPYGPDNYYRQLSNLTRHYFARNYIMVYQDVRGRFMSEGTFVNVRPYIPNKKTKNDIDESSDTYDTVDWLIKNIQNNNGRVGVRGISYPGFYTSMASIDAHPAVKATSPQAPVSKWMAGDDFFHNGAFLLSHAFDFFVRFGWPRPAPTKVDLRPFNPGTPDGYTFYMNLGPIPNANRMFMQDSVAFWNEIMNHGKWDDFWAARNILAHMNNIKPATLVVGGWFDTENLYGALHLYDSIERHGANDNRFVMGPWAHGWWAANNVDSLGSIKFGSNLSEYFAEQLEVPFFEYHLRGKGKPDIAEATVFMTGANVWKTFDSWPPKNAKKSSLYLSPNGRLSFEEPKAGSTAFDEYVSDPDKPVPYTDEITGWYNAAFMLGDQRFASRRPDVLVYQTEPLEEDIVISGPITASLNVSTSGTDCDWIVKLIDVFPDDTPNPVHNPRNIRLGGYQMLVRGDVLRGKFRNGLANPEAHVPDKITRTEFVLQDAFHMFRKGHRIMVQIQSTWFPMIDRNPGKMMDIYKAQASDFQKTTQRVYHSDKNRSYLELMVLE